MRIHVALVGGMKSCFRRCLPIDTLKKMIDTEKRLAIELTKEKQGCKG
jgi:hypothetical protein